MLFKFDEYKQDYVPMVHCADHGEQPLFGQDCQKCYLECIAELAQHEEWDREQMTQQEEDNKFYEQYG